MAVYIDERNNKRTCTVRYIVEPRYGGKVGIGGKEYRGGYMWTVLGQDAADSGFRGGKFGDIMARLGFDTNYWIAGHMLNEELGGYGEPKNFAPLTKVANRGHATYEGWIKKEYLERCKKLDTYENKYWYGIYYSVRASDAVFYDGPEKDDPFAKAPSHIIIEIRVMKVSKNNVLNSRVQGNLTELTNEEYALFNARRIYKSSELPLCKEIHNTEAEAGIMLEERTTNKVRGRERPSSVKPIGKISRKKLPVKKNNNVVKQGIFMNQAYYRTDIADWETDIY